MSGTFSQLYVQFIFAVGDAGCLISKEWSNALNQKITAILKEHKHKPIIVNGSSDHIHIFFVINPAVAPIMVADILKKESADFINESKFTNTVFSWQEGFGAFTYSKIRTNDVYLYITHQDKYHTKRTFREEFVEFLRLSSIEYDPMDLPKGIEEFNLVMDQ